MTQARNQARTRAKRGLGRGLDALLAGREHSESAEGKLRQVPIDLIEQNRQQPRRHFDAAQLDALADSIRQQGVLEPVLLRSLKDGRYELVAGERRWRAAQKASLAHIPALVRDIHDQDAKAIALIENMQRVDLRPLEQADGLHALIQEHGMTQQRLSEAVGLSRTKVANLLRLRALDREVKALLDEGHLDEGHAKVLLGLCGGDQVTAAREVAKRGLSVRQTEALVARLRSSGESDDGSATNAPAEHRDVARDADIKALERELAEQLGTQVRLETGARGKGRLVIHYSSLAVLDGILKRLR